MILTSQSQQLAQRNHRCYNQKHHPILLNLEIICILLGQEITTDAQGNVYVAYWDDKIGGDKKQFATISTDEGRTFSSPIQLKDVSNNNSENAIITAVSA